MKLKRLSAALLCLLLLAGCGAAPAETPDPSSAAEPANLGSFEAETLDGETLTQEYFSNAKLTMINVWATFCGPCQKEMPDLGNLDRELEDFQVLGVVTDVLLQDASVDPEQVDVARALVEAAGVDYPSLILNESLAKLGFASLTSVPTTLFVDEHGNFVGKGLVGAYSEARWREIIAERMEMIG